MTFRFIKQQSNKCAASDDTTATTVKTSTKGRFIKQYSAFLAHLGALSRLCEKNDEQEGMEFYRSLQTYYTNKSNNCNSDPIVMAHAVIKPLWGEIMHVAFGYTDPQAYSKLMDIINVLEKYAREVLVEHG